MLTAAQKITTHHKCSKGMYNNIIRALLCVHALQSWRSQPQSHVHIMDDTSLYRVANYEVCAWKLL